MESRQVRRARQRHEAKKIYGEERVAWRKAVRKDKRLRPLSRDQVKPYPDNFRELSLLSDRSKYDPHQGKREIARRLRQGARANG